MKGEFLKRALIGMGLAMLCGAIVGTIVYYCGKQNVNYSLLMYARVSFAYALIGFTVGGVSVLFQSEKLSLLSATVLHFLAILAAYFVGGLVGGWFISWGVGLLIPVAAFFASYLITWFSIYFGMKYKASKINKKLDEQHGKK